MWNDIEMRFLFVFFCEAIPIFKISLASIKNPYGRVTTGEGKKCFAFFIVIKPMLILYEIPLVKFLAHLPCIRIHGNGKISVPFPECPLEYLVGLFIRNY